MEYKKFLQENKPTLLEITDCNESIIAQCQRKSILNINDRSSLMAENDNVKRNDKFWEIVEKRNKCWGDLIAIFRQNVQNSVSELLERARMDENEKNGEQGKLVATTLTPPPRSGKKIWKLRFDDQDIVNDVLPRVQGDLVSSMQIEEANTRIVMKLNALAVFDWGEIEPVLSNNNWFTQQRRMIHLFAVIRTLDPDDIMRCLELLCNLEDQPNASGRFRNVFNDNFPGSVKLEYL